MPTREMTFAFLGKDVSASKTMNELGRSADNTGKHMAGLGKIAGGFALGAVFVSAGEKIKNFAEHSIDRFKEVGQEVIRLQRYTGGSAESMSRMRFAAQETGVDTDALAKGLGILEKHLGANDKAAQSLGVAFRDAHGKTLPFDQILPGIAEKFAKMPNGIDKTALVLKTFGKSGMALLPFLNKGKEGLAEFSKESDKLGLTLSGKDLAAVKANVIAHRTFHAAVEGLQIQVGRYLYPALTKITQAAVAAIPKFREFAGPILGVLGSIMSNQVLPAMQGLSNIFTNDLLPVLKDVAGWIGKHKTLMGALAVSVGAVVLGIKAWELGVAAVTAVTKAWAAVQAAFNVVMSANPVAIVVLAVAGLAAGLIYAYKHSETFRDIVQGVFKTVSGAGKDMWNVLKATFKFIADAFLDVAGAIINGAADMFGWVPGIGSKLKRAAKEFDAFRDSVNNSLGGINKHINIDIGVAEKAYSSSKIGQAVLKAVKGTDSRNQDGVAHRAFGGPVNAGWAYNVNERGQEIFIPAQNGQILSHADSMAAVSAGRNSDRDLLDAVRENTAAVKAVAAGVAAQLNRAAAGSALRVAAGAGR